MNKNFGMKKEILWKYFLKNTLLTFSLHFFGGVAFLEYKGIKDKNLILVVMVAIITGWLVFFQLPLTVLYLNHKKHSRTVRFEINDIDFVYSNKNESISFKQEDIRKIILSLSPTAYSNRIDFLYFGHFNFTTIYLKNGTLIKLSCLVFDKTIEYFEASLITKQSLIFPIMKKNVA